MIMKKPIKLDKKKIFIAMSVALILFYWLTDSITTALYLSTSGIDLVIPVIEITIESLIVMLIMILLLKAIATLIILLLVITINTTQITDMIFKGQTPPFIIKNTFEMTSFSILTAFMVFGIFETAFNIALLTGSSITPDSFDIVSNVLYIAVIGMVGDMVFTFKQDKKKTKTGTKAETKSKKKRRSGTK